MKRLLIILHEMNLMYCCCDVNVLARLLAVDAVYDIQICLCIDVNDCM